MAATQRKLYLIAGVTSLLLVAFNIVRISSVSITHDEALTYQRYVSQSYDAIVNNPQLTANNHILNSVLAKFFISTFADDIFFLRLPSLIGHIIYLLFSLLVARRLFRQNLWAIGCFLLLQLNPFMFEFWGLSRGYGLAIALLMGSLHFLLQYLQKHKPTTLIFSFLFLAAGIYTNFSLLNVATGIITVLIVNVLAINKKRFTLNTAIVSAGALAAIYFLVSRPIATLRARKELYYGGETGFIKDTIGSLLQESFYLKKNTDVVFIMAVCIAALVILSGIAWIVKTVMAGNKEHITGLSLWLLLTVPAFAILVQHWVFDTKFLIDRTALFFYPLFFVYVLYSLSKTKVPEPWRKAIVAGLLALFIVNFITNASVSTTRIWHYDSHTPWLVDRMVNLKKNEGKIKVYYDWMYEPSIRYYVPRNNAEDFDHLEGRYESVYEKTAYDFYLVRPWEIEKIPDIYTVDTVFADSTFYLYKRKQWDNNPD